MMIRICSIHMCICFVSFVKLILTWNDDHLELEQGNNFRTEDQGQKYSNN
jgi:hypothetical protein